MAIILKPENIAQLVFFVRGEKVMLDADLARLSIKADSREISCSNSPAKKRKV